MHGENAENAQKMQMGVFRQIYANMQTENSPHYSHNKDDISAFSILRIPVIMQTMMVNYECWDILGTMAGMWRILITGRILCISTITQENLLNHSNRIALVLYKRVICINTGLRRTVINNISKLTRSIIDATLLYINPMHVCWLVNPQNAFT